MVGMFNQYPAAVQAHHRFADGANSPGGGGDVVAEDPRSREDLPSADAQRATAGWQPLGCWRTMKHIKTPDVLEINFLYVLYVLYVGFSS